MDNLEIANTATITELEKGAEMAEMPTEMNPEMITGGEIAEKPELSREQIRGVGQKVYSAVEAVEEAIKLDGEHPNKLAAEAAELRRDYREGLFGGETGDKD